MLPGTSQETATGKACCERIEGAEERPRVLWEANHLWAPMTFAPMPVPEGQKWSADTSWSKSV